MGVNIVKYGNQTLIDLTDTTAVASDVAQGKYFYGKDGVKTEGTATGGGGTSNIVIGSFTTGSTRNTRGVVTIPYTGTGYPIALHVYIKNGVYNNGTGGNTTWYNSVSNRYDVGWFTMTKARQNTAPTYATSGEDNYGCTVSVYKNSTSSGTTYGRNLLMSANTYSSSSGNASGLTNTLIFRGSGTSLQYYIGNGTSSTGGLAPSTEYTYIVVYSS